MSLNTFDDTIGKIVRKLVSVPNHMLGTLLDIIRKLCGEDGEDWLRALKDCLQTSPRLFIEYLSSIILPATTEKFSAADKFVENITESAKTKIWGLSEDFEDKFLSKVEDPLRVTTLRYGVLHQSANNGRIIRALGGGMRVETTLTEMFFLMEQQGEGQEGILLTNVLANLFFIRDKDGVLGVVGVRWLNNSGWDILTFPIDDLQDWAKGSQVFYRGVTKPSAV
jgi:hypothetical protein